MQRGKLVAVVRVLVGLECVLLSATALATIVAAGTNIRHVAQSDF